MMNLERGSWRDIAMRASTEMDPEKLAALVEELCLEMDQVGRPAVPLLLTVCSKPIRTIPPPLTPNFTELAAIDPLCRELCC